MGNVSSTALAQEFLNKKGTEFIQSLYSGNRTAALVKNYPGVDGNLLLPTSSIEKPLILGYDGNFAPEDDAIIMDGVNFSTTMHKIQIKLDLGDSTMRAYKQYLKLKGLSIDEYSIVQYFLDDIQAQKKGAEELENAAWRAVGGFPASSGKPLAQTVVGFRRMLKNGAQLSTAKVTVVATGPIDKTNGVEKLEEMFTALDPAMQNAGVAICVSFKTYNDYLSNYHREFQTAPVELMVMGSTYAGIRFHLGAGNSYVIPFAGNGSDDGVAITTLDNLAYLYDVDMAVGTFEVQKQGFQTWILGKLPIGFGIRRLTKQYCVVNDRLIATS
jgi:hypothetical protein